jgi:transposase
LLSGDEDPTALAALAKGPLRKKRPQLEQALCGHLQPQQSFVLTELLTQIDCFDESIARFTAQIQATCAQDAAEAEVVALLDTIPGLAQTSAQVVVAPDWDRHDAFPLGRRARRMGGVGAGAQRERRTTAQDDSAVAAPARATPGCGPSSSILVQAAPAAAHTKHTALAARYRRIAARRGHKKAIVALAHALLVISYHVIARRQPYHEFGEDYFQRLDPQMRAKRLVHQLGRLGFEVVLQPQPSLVPAGGS